MKAEPGDHFTVVVEGREYDTVIDEHGVQRFVPNTLVMALVDAAGDAYQKFIQSTPVESRDWSNAPYGLNDLALEFYAGGKHSREDYIAFYTMFGMSVGGFADAMGTFELNGMKPVTIDNPLWEE